MPCGAMAGLCAVRTVCNGHWKAEFQNPAGMCNRNPSTFSNLTGCVWQTPYRGWRGSTVSIYRPPERHYIAKSCTNFHDYWRLFSRFYVFFHDFTHVTSMSRHVARPLDLFLDFYGCFLTRISRVYSSEHLICIEMFQVIFLHQVYSPFFDEVF